MLTVIVNLLDRLKKGFPSTGKNNGKCWGLGLNTPMEEAHLPELFIKWLCPAETLDRDQTVWWREGIRTLDVPNSFNRLQILRVQIMSNIIGSLSIDQCALLPYVSH